MYILWVFMICINTLVIHNISWHNYSHTSELRGGGVERQTAAPTLRQADPRTREGNTLIDYIIFYVYLIILYYIILYYIMLLYVCICASRGQPRKTRRSAARRDIAPRHGVACHIAPCRLIVPRVVSWSAKPRRATKEGQWVLKTLLLEPLFFSAQHGSKNLIFVLRPPFPLGHCLVGRCLHDTVGWHLFVGIWILSTWLFIVLLMLLSLLSSTQLLLLSSSPFQSATFCK